MEEKCEETSFVSTVILEGWRDVLWRHQDHERHVKVVRQGGESERIVRVQNEKCWSPGEGEQVSREQAAVLLELAGVLVIRGLDVSLGTHEDAPHVVAGVLRVRSGGEGAVSGDVEQQGAVGRKFFVSRGQEYQEVRQGWLVQQVLVWVVPPPRY